MCGHLSTPPHLKLELYLGEGYILHTYEEFYHQVGFTYPLLPVLTAATPHEVTTLAWGLIPPWVANRPTADVIKSKTLNATCEGVFDKPSFKPSIMDKRCLILVDGFFEWQHAGKEKRPYYIYRPNHEPFAMGGLYADWIDRETGEATETCTIITTPANALMSEIHNSKKRMPLIIDRQDWDIWLDPSTSRETLELLMRPAPEKALTAHPVSRLITSRAHDTNVPEVQMEMRDWLF